MTDYYTARACNDLTRLTAAQRQEFRDQAVDEDDWRTVDEIDTFNAARRPATATRILQAAEQWLALQGRVTVNPRHYCAPDLLAWDAAWDTAHAIAEIDNGDASVPWVAATGPWALRYWISERARMWASLLAVLTYPSCDD